MARPRKSQDLHSPQPLLEEFPEQTKFTAQEWEDFIEKNPYWAEIVKRTEYAMNYVAMLVLDNEALHSVGRDNFPEVKFERGRFQGAKAILGIPHTCLEEAKVKELRDAKARGEGSTE